MCLPISIKLNFVGKVDNNSIAHVLIPSHLPKYGSDELKNFPININILKACEFKIETFISIMAHELSHVILHSLRNQYRDSEIATDILAMILGFSGIIENGRKITTEYTVFNVKHTEIKRFGYLDDNQFECAYRIINYKLTKTKKNRDKLSKLVNKFYSLLSKYKTDHASLTKNLHQLGNMESSKIKTSQANRLCELHSNCYYDSVMSVISRNENYLSSITIPLSDTNKISTIHDCLMSKYVTLEDDYKQLHNDLSLVIGCLPLFVRIKSFISTS